MKIINKSKNIVLAEDASNADNPFKRMKGLLGKKEFMLGKALILKPCNSIHTFFMRFPIDVLFINKENKVIAFLPSFKPFRLTRIYPASSSVIEFPSGTLKPNLVERGDIIALE